MQTIHKFEVPALPGVHRLSVRGLVEWIDAGAQGDRLVLWAAVLEPSNDVTECGVAVVWTGDIVPEGTWKHFRTVQIGRLVHHLFLPAGFAK